MIGLSLSFCIKDILTGQVAESDVERIEAGTKFRDESEFEEVLDSYRYWYWSVNPTEGMNIARRLYSQGKIVQPRLTGGEAHNVAGGHWL